MTKRKFRATIFVLYTNCSTGLEKCIKNGGHRKQLNFKQLLIEKMQKPLKSYKTSLCPHHANPH